METIQTQTSTSKQFVYTIPGDNGANLSFVVDLQKPKQIESFKRILEKALIDVTETLTIKQEADAVVDYTK